MSREPWKNISHLTRINRTPNSSKTIVHRKIVEGLNLRKILLRYKDDYLEWRMEMRGIIWSKVCSMKAIGHGCAEQLPHNWSTISNGAAFGTDYFTRTAVAKSNIFANSPKETKYFYHDLDKDGLRLNGSGRYTVFLNISANNRKE